MTTICYITARKTNIIPILSLSLPLILLSSQSVLAAKQHSSNFIEQYSPHIGYEHKFTRYVGHVRSGSRYTPRLYLGIMPIQADHYKFGIEIGYTLPSSYGNDKESMRFTSSDLFFTFSKAFTSNTNWFLKPGLEYRKSHYKYNGSYFYMPAEAHRTNLYPVIQTGLGYVFNKNLSLNVAVGSKLNSLTNDNGIGQKFIFSTNIEYAF